MVVHHRPPDFRPNSSREACLPQPEHRATSDSLREYGRGVAGGLLFSLPLLYTMEVWDAGFSIPPHRQLAYLLGTFVLLLFVLGRLGPELRLHEVMGRIVVGALTVAIGVSVGTAQLGGDPARRGSDERQVGLGSQIALAVCGAVLVAANVAPT